MSIEWGINLHLDDMDDRVHAAFPAALAKAMEHVRGEAVRQTPVETGNLAGSAAVTVSADHAELTYPGPYARRQHYELDWHHNTGNALYLELPMVQEAPKVFNILSDEIGKVL